MRLNRVIRFRVSEVDEQRLIELAAMTGGTVSDVLRQLLSSAELQPTSTFRPVASLKNSEASGLVLPDAATSFAR